jgi:putative MFS transporter
MLFRPPLVSRLLLGCLCLVVINTLLYGFVTWLPTFFVKQGLSIATSFGYTLLMACGAPIGAAIGALTADRWGRKATIIGASAVAVALGALYPSIHDPVLLPLVGFGLTVPIYVLVALLFGIYIPELFPTEIRLRGAGLCNMVGRGATIVTPYLVVALFNYGRVGAVMSLMVALLLLQIAFVFLFGIEPANQSLEALQPAPEVPEGRPVAAES